MNKKEPFDWTERKTLQECMMYMLKNEIMCDVTFHVGGSRKAIKAHKNILASRSPKFRSMFDGSQTGEGEINVPNIDEDTFNALLKFAYSDDITITTKNVKSMLFAAEEYSLSSIMSTCSELLISTAKSADSVLTLSTANQFHLGDLQKESLQYIEDNTGDCLLSVYALEVNSACVQQILESENLSCSETDLCKFFLQWAETQCKRQRKELNADNLRSIAGELVSLVKFPLVEKKYFSTEVSTSLLLTRDEIQSVFLYHKGTKCQMFSDKPRCPRKATFICRHKPTLNYSVCEIPSYDELTFRSNKPFWLIGCVIFGPVNEISESGSFTFHLHDNSKNIICSENLNIVSVHVLDQQRVATRVSKPILISANTPYTICVQDFIPCDEYYVYDDNDMLEEVHGKDDCVITFPVSSEPFSTYGRQISGIVCNT